MRFNSKLKQGNLKLKKLFVPIKQSMVTVKQVFKKVIESPSQNMRFCSFFLFVLSSFWLLNFTFGENFPTTVFGEIFLVGNLPWEVGILRGKFLWGNFVWGSFPRKFFVKAYILSTPLTSGHYFSYITLTFDHSCILDCFGLMRVYV